MVLNFGFFQGIARKLQVPFSPSVFSFIVVGPYESSQMISCFNIYVNIPGLIQGELIIGLSLRFQMRNLLSKSLLIYARATFRHKNVSSNGFGFLDKLEVNIEA